METAYAQALWNMVSAGTAPTKAVHSLTEILKTHGREALLPRIGRAFARIAERESKRTSITLTIAREKDERAAKHAVKDTLSQLAVDSKDVQIVVDESLIGGWRLEGKETLVDASYKRELLELFNRSVNA